jgi:tetratricopeptide (TPR) repeat protein
MTAGRSLEDMLREAGALRQAGRWAEAEAAYQRVLAQAPGLADSWYNLALVQRRLGRPHEALASYQRALDCGVREPEEVRLNRAVIFTDDLRQDDEAERELKAALTLNARYTPALLNLGNLAEDRGQRAAAADYYARILEIEPQHWEALARQANAHAFTDAGDPLMARLQAALARADVGPADRANLGFALGRALDACELYDDAFAAYVAANAASRAAAPGARYDRAAQERFIAEIKAAFPMAPVRQEAGAKATIFICGMFRSGSTLIEQVLDAHARVTAGGELPFLPAIVAGELAPFPAAVRLAGEAKLADIARRYREAVARVFPGADLVTDKRPDNFLYVGLIKTLFPNARIIHTVRHPLDNCLSAYFLHLSQDLAYALDLEDTGHFFRSERELMGYWKSQYPDDIFELDYDAFVQAPRERLEPLLAFLGLDWDEACLSFHDKGSSVKTASVWQVRQPLYQRSSGRWRNYARHLEPLRTQLSDLLPDG